MNIENNHIEVLESMIKNQIYIFVDEEKQECYTGFFSKQKILDYKTYEDLKEKKLIFEISENCKIYCISKIGRKFLKNLELSKKIKRPPRISDNEWKPLPLLLKHYITSKNYVL